MRQVSVPLRGLWFLSSASYSALCDLQASFPSPCGDYGSYHDDAIANGESYYYVSVPLRGLWFLSVRPCQYKSLCRGFRPLAGIMVLINMVTCNQRKGKHCFRPLAGIMVLIRTLYKCLYEAVEMAFCGADHIFSSFFVFCRKMIFKKLLRTEF